jgi:hypothetical protein
MWRFVYERLLRLFSGRPIFLALTRIVCAVLFKGAEIKAAGGGAAT